MGGELQGSHWRSEELLKNVVAKGISSNVLMGYK